MVYTIVLAHCANIFTLTMLLYQPILLIFLHWLCHCVSLSCLYI